MDTPTNVTVYCDANFLVAYGARQTRQPAIQRRAQILFAELLVNNCKIAASPLSFDEAWNGVRKEAGPKRIKNKIYFFLNNLINKFGFYYKHNGADEFSFGDVLNKIKDFTAKLIASPKFAVIQFPVLQEKEGVSQSLDNIERLNFKPRDSFHLSIMQLNKVQYVVTRDKKFKNSGINVLSF